VKRQITLMLLFMLMASCAAEPTSTPAALPVSTMTSSPIPATATFPLSPLPPTDTVTPSPTPLPGLLVLPVDTLGKTIPWLPLDEKVRPGVHFVAFNTLRPPFNSALVRQAFAYAINRRVIVEMAKKYKASNPNPATTLTPPETLGRDLYNEVGTGFDSQKAKELLIEAGYSDPSGFPAVTMIVSAYGDIAPGARFNMAGAMADMWKAHLGIPVQVEVINTYNDYGNRLKNNPPEIFWQGWVADFNDPDNFLREIFHTGSQNNYGSFSNSGFDQLVDRAKRSRDPAERQELYIQAERLLCETEAALIPLYHTR
jgi:oligopeptide transport system substrate-binding protein